ncbi:hypothetical protein QP519_06410 [Weeksella virosa]|uniref:hypothetical protein n=1 Tax=Weeksella virosa TaxID=1014 RepID=UPI0025574945|nr:hypothetical protein [Weeksella virosa]MDK7375172.1 hypothetical protein [Weeksella virosa]
MRKFIEKVGMDKVAHFFGSAFLTLFLASLKVNIFIVLVIITILGIVKEKTDEFFDERDIVVNTLGYILGVVSFFIIMKIK